MKRYILLGVAILLLIVGIVIFGQDLFIILKNNNQIIQTIVILGLFFLLMVSIHLLINSKLALKNRRLNERLKTWSLISYRVDQVGEEAFNELPIGMIAFDEIYDVSWTNPFVNTIFKNNILHKSIEDISLELYNFITEQKTNGIVMIENKHYDVIYKKEFNFFYLFDVSARELLNIKYKENIQAMAIMSLDNLDESFSSLDLSEQSSLKGEYLSSIHDWVLKYKGYLKSFSDDRLLLITSQKELRKMMEDKFDVLDEIREMSVANGLKITLSMGFASWDIDYEELGLYAQNAIELAQKRGGDQVVVNIQNEKTVYFGAKTDALAKASRVSSRINAQTIKDLINESDQVFIMGHAQTDLDAFGSSIAAYHMASIDKKAYIVFDFDMLDNTVKRLYQTLEENNESVIDVLISTPTALKKITDKSLLIVVDTQSPKMVMSPEVLAAVKDVIVIDHHRISEEGFNAVFSVVEASASSTIELMMEIIAFYDESIKFKPVESSIMYGGLIVDTNQFTVRTSARTFEVAHQLKEQGADTQLVKLWLRRDLTQTILINKLLSNIDIYLNRFAFLVSDEVVDDRVLIALAAEQALNIHGIDATFVISKTSDNAINVSARSIQNINVQLAMEVIGGGGHLNSAAAQVKDKTLNEVVTELKEYLNIEYGIEDEKMKVILLEDVKGKGKKDDVVDLANGYAQFLLNNKKAVVADEVNLKKLQAEKDAKIEAEKMHLELMNKVKQDIDGKKITLQIQIGKDGKLFGSVTTKQIAEKFESEHGITLDRKKIELTAEINSAGIYTATVYLYKGIKAQFDVVVEEQ